MNHAATPAEDSTALRRGVIDSARALYAAGINVNKSGNVSVRCSRGRQPGLLITPTGLGYERLQPADLVFVRLADGAARGERAPSSEWRFHLDICRRRPEFAAIVHTHSASATALACHGRGIPAFHYMVAAAGGADIRCAPYATFGTQELSDHALAALADRRACLLTTASSPAAPRWSRRWRWRSRSSTWRGCIWRPARSASRRCSMTRRWRGW